MASVGVIYHMLAYTFDLLNEESYTGITGLDLQSEGDLLGKILAKGVAKQVSKGLERAYETKTDLLSTLRGSININETIKGFYQEQMKLVCDFDEYTENSYLNKILKTTMERLLMSNYISDTVQHEISQLLIHFLEVDVIPLREIRWSSIHYHRNNQTYRMLMNICHLVLQGLQSQESNAVMNFLDNEYMQRLYTRFWLEFLENHCPEIDVWLPTAQGASEYLNEVGLLSYLRAPPEIFRLTYKSKQYLIMFPYYDRDILKTTGLSTGDLLVRDLQQLRSVMELNSNLGIQGRVSAGLIYGWSDHILPEDVDIRFANLRTFTKCIDMKGSWYSVFRCMKSILLDLFEHGMKFLT